MTPKQHGRLIEKNRLLARLEREGEDELASKIRCCGDPIMFTCEHCGQETQGHCRCKRKWCPRCAPAIAAERSQRLAATVQRFRWPLFVTLTMKNVDDLNFGAVRHLRRSFGKMRHKKFWKKNVKGGIASIEVTNIGNGWHPHLHAVLDCRWLSVHEPEVRSFYSREEKKACFEKAASELGTVWAKYLGQPLASIKIKRCSAATITKEVVKYSVKGTDLLACAEKVGPLIHALEACRLVTTFGTAHGRVQMQPESTSEKTDNSPTPGLDETRSPHTCCSSPQLLPTAVFDRMTVGERGWRSVG